MLRGKATLYGPSSSSPGRSLRPLWWTAGSVLCLVLGELFAYHKCRSFVLFNHGSYGLSRVCCAGIALASCAASWRHALGVTVGFLLLLQGVAGLVCSCVIHAGGPLSNIAMPIPL